MKAIVKGYALDLQTIELLRQIAEHEAYGDKPNASRALRIMIRQRAQVLGIVLPAGQSKSPAKEKPAAG